MKIIVFLSIIFLSSQIACADSNESEPAIKAEKQGAFKGFFYKVWTRFKTMSPKNEREIRVTTVTAGIRGAETTSTILKPYWKDDKTSDENFINQLEDFVDAQTMADKGDLASANKAFNAYINKYPEGDLKPNAQFAEALTMAAMGENDNSSRSFRQFIEDNPQHPLVDEAKSVMNELN